MSRLTRLLSAAAVLALLHGCDTDRIAGTNNETQTKGTFFRPDGKPAVGARVRVYAASQKETDSTSTQVTQVYVDANGYAPLNLTTGYYSLMADDKALGGTLFIDSAFSDGRKIDLPVDTLRPTGTITGHVRVQPMHSPSIAWVHLMRTNLYANVDSTGFFRITGVPAGNLDLVAVTHLSQYTPTHKLVRARPDSVIDADTIDLVYNGLPLVTGIVATYDTLSGVVTVGWKDTAYARKAGYVIYLQEGKDTWMRPVQRGYSTSSTFRDTIFGGIRAFRSPVDSAELDLTYWVGADGTDTRTLGPLWEKVRLHVKSPALANRWHLQWGPTHPFAKLNAKLDTIEGGLVAWTSTAALSDPQPPRTLEILGSDGIWVRHPLPATSSNQDPVFWGGKVWLVEPFALRDSVLDTTFSFRYDQNDTIHYPVIAVFDSVRIRSSRDGLAWDTTKLATENDSTDRVRLVPTSGSLFVEFKWHQYRFYPGFTDVVSAGGKVLRNGSGWSARLSLPEGVASAWNGSHNPFALFPDPQIIPIPSGDWTTLSQDFPIVQNGPVHTLYRGIGTDPSKLVLESPTQILLRGIDSLVVIQRDGFLGLAKASDPLTTQWITSSNSVRSFTFWRGQLVVLRPDGISMATIR